MTQKTTPLEALQVLTILTSLAWTPAGEIDHMNFADAGPGALVADIGADSHSQIAELFDFRAALQFGMQAIIGGDALQVEIHGLTEDGECIWIAIPITFDINN